MSSSRSNFSESSSITVAQPSLTPLRQQSDDAAPPPRWGLLAAAVVAALVTALWIGSDILTADSDMMDHARSAQAPGK